MNNSRDRLIIEEHNGKQLIFVDYRGLKEKEMIELVNNHLELTLKTKLPFLADYHNAYGTPGYMAHARVFAERTKGIIDKGAFLGINQVKSFILKGVVLLIGVNYQAFESKDRAIEFLTTDNLDSKEKY
jgi:hypothetical protein